MNYLKDKRVYLSGPIECALENDLNWRTEPKRILTQELGVNLFDPFDDLKQQWVPILRDAREAKDYDTMSRIASDFVRKDLCMVDRSDFIIAYLPYKIPTTGTHHEIINSNAAKKPTLLICPDGKNKNPLWYFGFIKHKFMFGNWNDLFNYLREVDQGLHKEEDRWKFVYGLV